MLSNKQNIDLEQLKSLPIIVAAIALLEEKLPGNLYYHSIDHTKRVIEKSVVLAIHDKLRARDIELIAIAAAYHDVGFTVRYNKNEAIGASLAKEAMTKAGNYSEPEIQNVEGMILSTELLCTDNGFERVAKTKLAHYLLDADLATFGEDNFLEHSELLRQERGQDFASFYKETPLMLKDHHWFTDAATELLEPTKIDNIKKLDDYLKTQTDDHQK